MLRYGADRGFCLLCWRRGSHGEEGKSPVCLSSRGVFSRVPWSCCPRRCFDGLFWKSLWTRQSGKQVCIYASRSYLRCRCHKRKNPARCVPEVQPFLLQLHFFCVWQFLSICSVSSVHMVGQWTQAWEIPASANTSLCCAWNPGLLSWASDRGLPWLSVLITTGSTGIDMAWVASTSNAVLSR